MTYSRQETFDRVLAHLRKQGERAFNDDRAAVITGCKYRLNGLMCAIGCLIPDEAYNPKWDEKNVTPEQDNTILDAAGLPREELDFALELQTAHDEASNDFLFEIELSMKQIAKRFNLIYSGPVQ